MASDADRRALYAALHEHLGERPASILMEMLPPVMPSELARRSDLVAVRGEMAELRGELRGEMAELRSELQGEMAELRAELRAEMAELRTELKGEMAELRGEMAELRGEVRGDFAMLTARLDAQIPRFLLASVPMTLGFGGMVLAAAKLA